jgi:SWIM zinc finger
MAVRPTHDQVLLLAPDRGAASAAVPLAVPGSWSATGCDDGAVWGAYIATSAEPYNVAVDLSDDLGGPAYRCSCPSRKIPCKHALALLLLHADGHIVPARRLPFAAEWLQRRSARSRNGDSGEDDDAADVETLTPVPSHDGGESGQAGEGALGGGARSPNPPFEGADPQRQKRQFERAERMRAGLQELDRWLADRIRVGLAASELSEIDTWDRLAARLVDAQCGALANRVKRVATRVGSHPHWHEDVLEEMALMHALAVGAQRTSALAPALADGVHIATGLTVAKDDVLAGVPSTATWIVAGESRTREDRITVQRTWLASAGQAPVTWAMVLAFGAFGNEVTTEHQVGTAIDADLHWYPGGIALRAIIGRVNGEPMPAAAGPAPTTIADATKAYGWALAGEPWLERYPMCIAGVPAPLGNGRWVIADHTGALAVAAGFTRMAEVVSVSGGYPIRIVGEWSAEGFAPLTLFGGDQAVVL